MTQGFYEQLGIEPEASTKEIRQAYNAHVARLMRRRRSLLEKGGDTGSIDLARSQADEAWAVLSDPGRRRRYDALCALGGDEQGLEPAELWKRVAGALVPPATATAAELLRVSTNLSVGALPPAPRSGGAPRSEPVADDEVTVTATGVTKVPEATGPVVPLPVPKPSLKVVEGRPSAPPVLVMPSRPEPPKKALDVRRLVDELGYSGELLRKVREGGGLSLQDMADTTRISVRYLEAIEADEHDRLPSATFVRGYVREMARLLGLDEEQVTSGYMRRFSP